MTEQLIILLLTSGVLLWMIGGTYWRPARTFIWPILAGVILFFSHIVLLKVVLMTLTLIGVTSLPYGDKTSWPLRLLVFGAYALPGIWLNPSRLLVSVPLCVGGLALFMLLSRKLNFFTWKLFEALAGLLQALALIISV